VPPLGIALLVATKGEAGLPLGTLAWLGTGEARVGGEVGPFGVAVIEVLVASVLTCVAVTSVLAVTTRAAWAEPVADSDETLLAVVLSSKRPLDLGETDMALHSRPIRAARRDALAEVCIVLLDGANDDVCDGGGSRGRLTHGEDGRMV
jgi:hypothetical protein